ncbi:LacI family DNA-binding transcriptional regulator [Vibrio algarum]|uniref:LacI family DNA-binding transcriptional regulator n=1 Tax=Vibrio algarum TaxID=3020714 RepID=A0ABT4YP37_9VIBR|nr:LacI family DNA-binding transcriptional regulator [Vibrio sp. KJ40-1]MDB1123150.1 LacI family DNA-binding transcriptional regulator [Vibrio sp. KJ40-1]
MSVTFKDVAELAGVSTQTVSRVTNDSSNVAEGTRKKVMEAIEKLGYVPNKGAQLLSRAKSNVIGLVTLDIGLHGVSLIANGIRRQADKEGFGTSFSVVIDPTFENILNSVRDLKSQKTETIIINVPMDKPSAEALVQQHGDIHFVFIDVPASTKVNTVCSAHYTGGCLAAQLMLEDKRENLLLITGPNDSSASLQRVEGWKDTLAGSTATIQAIYEGNWQASSAYLHTRQAIAEGIEFDSILVASDQMSLGVLRALDEFSISVPKQVSVIGYDDIADCAYFSPPLTTIMQDFQTIGQIAVELALDDSMDNRNSKKQTVNTELKVRKSTAIKEKSSYDKIAIQKLLADIDKLLP